MLGIHNLRDSFRLEAQAGFSLIEVMVASAIGAFIAMGTGKAILNVVSEKKKMEYRSQEFALASQAKAMFETRLASDPARCSQFFTNVDGNFANNARQSLSDGGGALGGARVRITLPNGMVLSDGAVLGNATNGVRITDVRFANAEVFYTDPTTNSTYYNGQVFIKGEKLGLLNGKGYTTKYAPTLIASVTVQVVANAITNCATLPSFENNRFCENIRDMNGFPNPLNPNEEFCAPDVRTFAAVCPAGQRFVGFSHDTFTVPICVGPADFSCATMRDKVLRGIRQSVAGGADGVEVSAPECVETEQAKHEKQCKATDCTPKPTDPGAPRRPLDPVHAAVNVNGGPGTVGNADCPSAAAIEQYERCVQYAAEAVASGSAREIACGNMPTKCYTPTAAIVPVNPASVINPLVDPPPPVVPPVNVGCNCGGGPPIAHGDFCGSYYNASYGFFYTELIASVVLRCDNGSLVLHSDTSPINPAAAPAQVVVPNPDVLDVSERTGNYLRLNKTGINQYAIP